MPPKTKNIKRNCSNHEGKESRSKQSNLKQPAASTDNNQTSEKQGPSGSRLSIVAIENEDVTTVHQSLPQHMFLF